MLNIEGNRSPLLIKTYSPSNPPDFHASNENIRPRLCILHKWPHYDGYGIHLARSDDWTGLRIGEIEPESPAESAGLIAEDIVLSINGQSIEHVPFFTILSMIQHALQQNQIRFLVIDPQGAEIVRQHNLHIDEDHINCTRIETGPVTFHLRPNLPEPTTSNEETQPISIDQEEKSETKVKFTDEKLNQDDHVTQPRLCTVILRPGFDSIGIAIQSDDPFGHKIKDVEAESPAALAGIQKNDCIISLNNKPLLNRPYEEVLDFLRNSRQENKLDFIVSQKSDLMKLYRLDDAAEDDDPERQTKTRNIEESPSNEEYARRVLITEDSKAMNEHLQGEIVHGFGPAVSDQASWKHDNSQQPRENTTRSIQLGITNPSPTIPKRLISPKIPNSQITQRVPHVLDNIVTAVPSVPPQQTNSVDEDDKTVQDISHLHLATIPISELEHYNYTLHQIHLRQPNPHIPVGLKLTKNYDPLQYLITVVIEGSQADLAGLKPNDWLVQLEDEDIRLTEFKTLSQDIQDSLSIRSLVNMVVARKISTESSSIKMEDKTIDQENEIQLDPSENEKNEGPVVSKSDESDTNEIRNITLGEALGLDFNSYIPDDKRQVQVHFISNVQPTSMAEKAGLKDGDRLLSINGIDATQYSHDEVRKLMSTRKQINLAVLNEPKFLELVQSIDKQQKQTLSTSLDVDFNGREEKLKHVPDDLIDLFHHLFTDIRGPVYYKKCRLRKKPNYDSFGFLLRHNDDLHVIDAVEPKFPAYKCGLRESDVVLQINQENVENFSHDDVKKMIRSLASAQEPINFILIRKNDATRYQTYKTTNCVGLETLIGSNIDENPEPLSVNTHETSSKNDTDTVPQSSDVDTRLCVIEMLPNTTAGFAINGMDPAPFKVCKIEKDSPAEKSGLKLKDALVSVNGRSIADSSYEDAIAVIKEELLKKRIQLVVQKYHSSKSERSQAEQRSSNSDISGISVSQGYQNDSAKGAAQCSNPVQQYKDQRMKESSYVLRLCHLNAINSEGVSIPNFGFEIAENAELDYPVVSYVEPKLPGARAGLESGDILLKINDRKTKGLDFDKVKKALEKAKRDGRLEMLVIDLETFEYCKQNQKQMKEPDLKVKHIFPRSKSSANVVKLQSINSMSTGFLQGSLERLRGSDEALQTKEIEAISEAAESKAEQKTTEPFNGTKALQKTTSSPSQDTPDAREKKRLSLKHSQRSNSSPGIDTRRSRHASQETSSTSNTRIEPATQERIASNLQTNGIMNRAKFEQSDENRLRRCLVRVVRDTGLGFVLCALGDYDHTITIVEKNSAADTAGLRAGDALIAVNGNDVRSVRYQDVVEMLMSAIQTDDVIEMSVIDSRFRDSDLRIGTPSTLKRNSTTADNNSIKISRSSRVQSVDDISSRLTDNAVKRSPKITSLDNQDFSNNLTYSRKTGSLPGLTTGITALPEHHRTKRLISSIFDGDFTKEIPIARLCRLRKFPKSDVYGFYLCGSSKKPGRIFVADVTKNSPASICGLRDGDRILEVNGVDVQFQTYEEVLNRMKEHVELNDLDLLVLDKKAIQWYRERKFPISTETLPAIVQIEPFINVLVDENLNRDQSNENDEPADRL